MYSKKKKNNSGIIFIYLLSIFIFLAGLILLGYFLYNYYHSGREKGFIEYIGSTIEEAKEECRHRRVLDGICVKSNSRTITPVVGAMIDNHVDARPPSGLSEARIVYETHVEGNITRFLALYPLDFKALKVGPVRSARPYYLDWLAEYGDAMYMHVGGSPDALDEIKESGVFDINEFYRGWYFWRSEERYAPHNVYTSSKLWGKAWKDYRTGKEAGVMESWVYNDKENCEAGCVNKINISFIDSKYDIEWRYTSSTGKYERFNSEEPHLDENGSGIFADTIVIQKIKSKVIDQVGRKQIDTIGKGEVIVFRDEYAFEGEWIKEDLKGKTRWYDENGTEIPLKAGKIWIEALDEELVDLDF